MIRANFHTHTLYCDGKNTAEEMVKSAIEQNCEAIGFTGHSYVEFGTDYCMLPAKTIEYKAEIKRLAEAYKDKIHIFLGVEQDYFSVANTEEYQYIIGSVHHIKKAGTFFAVDNTAEEQISAVKEFYGGDFYTLCEDYFETVADVARKTGCQIIGHFDLITKFNDNGILFDEGNRRYRLAALTAIEELAKKDVIFEINTGAVSRGYKKVPYPATFILEEICRKSGRIMLNSDSHSKDTILYGFDRAEALAKKTGFKNLMTFTGERFEEKSIGISVLKP